MIPDGAVLISDGVIRDVGPSRRLENLAYARNAREIDATGRVVMPGFVDSHTHLLYGMPWSHRKVGSDALQTLSARRLELRARARVNGMIKHGTTTLEVKSGYGLDVSGELKLLRVVAKLNGNPLDVMATFLSAHPIPVQFQNDPTGYQGWMANELMPKLQQRRLARFADVFCERDGLDLNQARRFLESAREHGFLLKVHADQFAHTGATRLAVEFGAVSADHLEQATEEDINLLARSSTMATLLPGCVFHLGSERYAPARDLVDSGAAVALATNFNLVTSPTYNMQMIIAIACSHMNMTPAEAVAAATINGAHAIRLADKVGSLEVGKYADLVLMNIPDYHEIPNQAGVNNVHLTMKRGEIIYEEGRVAG